MPSVDAEIWSKRWQQAKVHPWPFLKYFVSTWDEHDRTENAMSKPFPIKAMYRIITRCWLEHDILFIEKSRQIMMTWQMTALFLWDGLFHRVTRTFFQSKKEEDAAAILDRARHIYEELVKLGSLVTGDIPEVKRVGKKTGTDLELVFPSVKGRINAIPQGPDIVRSYTWSGGLGDEMNHQPKFGDGFAAVIPGISGGGKFTGVGTPNGKTAAWRMLYGIPKGKDEPAGPNIFDSDLIKTKRFIPPPDLDEEQQRHWIDHAIVSLPDEEFNAIPLVELVAAMPGMRLWQTCEGGYSLSVHYSADPDKSPQTTVGRAWIAAEKKRIKDRVKWNREYEIDYSSPEGTAVIENWDDLFISKESLEYDQNEALYLAVDFGTVAAVVCFAQYVYLKEFKAHQMRILDEILLKSSDSFQLADAAIQKMRMRFNYALDSRHFRTHCDPAGNQTSPTTSNKSLNTDIKIFRHKGLSPQSKKFGITESTDFVKAVFNNMLSEKTPGVLVDPRCKYLISCLEGGWHYPQSSANDGQPKPAKDGVWDHGGDVIRILFNNVIKTQDIYRMPSYRVICKPIREKQSGRIVGWDRPVKTKTRRLGDRTCAA